MPYPADGLIVRVVCLPIFFQIIPLSNPGITCPEPTVKIKGAVSECCSKTFPSGNVATTETAIVSQRCTRSVDEHPVNTSRERTILIRYTP